MRQLSDRFRGGWIGWTVDLSGAKLASPGTKLRGGELIETPDGPAVRFPMMNPACGGPAIYPVVKLAGRPELIEAVDRAKDEEESATRKGDAGREAEKSLPEGVQAERRAGRTGWDAEDADEILFGPN